MMTIQDMLNQFLHHCTVMHFLICHLQGKDFPGLCVHGNMDFEITPLPFVSYATPLVRHPLAPVGYLDSCAVNCNHKIIITCLDATVEIGFQPVDSFANVSITGMVWQGLSSSPDYSLGLPVRQMKIYPHVTNGKNKRIWINEFSFPFLFSFIFASTVSHSSRKPWEKRISPRLTSDLLYEGQSVTNDGLWQSQLNSLSYATKHCFPLIHAKQDFSAFNKS